MYPHDKSLRLGTWCHPHDSGNSPGSYVRVVPWLSETLVHWRVCTKREAGMVEWLQAPALKSERSAWRWKSYKPLYASFSTLWGKSDITCLTIKVIKVGWLRNLIKEIRPKDFIQYPVPRRTQWEASYFSSHFYFTSVIVSVWAYHHQFWRSFVVSHKSFNTFKIK